MQVPDVQETVCHLHIVFNVVPPAVDLIFVNVHNLGCETVPGIHLPFNAVQSGFQGCYLGPVPVVFPEQLHPALFRVALCRSAGLCGYTRNKEGGKCHRNYIFHIYHIIKILCLS